MVISTISGTIDVKFPCGCIVTLYIRHESSPEAFVFTGTTVEVDAIVPCESHEDHVTPNNLDAYAIFEEACSGKADDVWELLYHYDSFELDKDITEFVLEEGEERPDKA